MPTKRRDPGGCIIPCEIGNTIFTKCLLDQGSGISLMTLKTARAIGLGERMEPIDITLQLADHSIVKPTGIVEDILVKIDKFIIHVDFIVLDMPEDREVPILFGRPFLATEDVLLGAKDNSVTFRINGEQLTINVEKAYVGGDSGKKAREVVTLESPKVWNEDEEGWEGYKQCEQVTIEVCEDLEKQNEALLTESERQNAAPRAKLVRQNAELSAYFEKK
ncbi:uncharacterized protein LOC121804199 [Salvia splendens]|uniref:uncharacterized protein LOC121804199 n=1 Tax=Salvia splendens TaxID=180675 RepID=UPI001C2517A2|nr:uncharacterized protein LOC121804199 [Salvia splendens]